MRPIRARLAVALGASLLALGYVLGHTPDVPADNPVVALRAYQEARIEAIAECAKYGFATELGQVAPDSKIADACMSLVAQPCVSVPVMPPKPRTTGTDL